MSIKILNWRWVAMGRVYNRRGSIFIWAGRRKEKSGWRIHKINVSRPENVGCCRRVEKCWILGSLRCKKMAFQLRPLFLTNVMERFELHIKSKDRGGNVPPWGRGWQSNHAPYTYGSWKCIFITWDPLNENLRRHHGCHRGRIFGF